MRVGWLLGTLLFVGIAAAVATSTRSSLLRDAERERELLDWVA